MLQALELFANDKRYFGKLVDLALVSVAKDGGRDHGFSLLATIVDFIWLNNGIQQARDFYKWYEFLTFFLTHCYLQPIFAEVNLYLLN